MAAALQLGPTPSVASRRRAVGMRLPVSRVHATFDVGPDGTVYFTRPVRDERLVLVRDLGTAIRTVLAERKKWQFKMLSMFTLHRKRLMLWPWTTPPVGTSPRSGGEGECAAAAR
jgi:hypothetical protein